MLCVIRLGTVRTMQCIGAIMYWYFTTLIILSRPGTFSVYVPASVFHRGALSWAVDGARCAHHAATASHPVSLRPSSNRLRPPNREDPVASVLLSRTLRAAPVARAPPHDVRHARAFVSYLWIVSDMCRWYASYSTGALDQSRCPLRRKPPPVHVQGRCEPVHRAPREWWCDRMHSECHLSGPSRCTASWGIVLFATWFISYAVCSHVEQRFVDFSHLALVRFFLSLLLSCLFSVRCDAWDVFVRFFLIYLDWMRYCFSIGLDDFCQ